MRLFPRLSLALVFVFGLSPAGAVQRVALVVGNSDYKLVSPLANPKNDAALMAETLSEVGFDVIEAKNTDRRGMARAIRDFGKRLRRAGPEAVGLFFYAGHGVQATGTNYLIPLGAPVEDEADLEIEAVSASWVLGQMESAGNALNIVILDACRNNPFKRSFRSATRGLARMDAPSGSLIAYSAGPGKVAADGDGSNSPYTAALVAAMREPGLDLEDVFKRVRVAVEKATAKSQTPWEESSLKGDFYFVPQGSTVTVTPPGAPPAFDARALELAFWQSITDSDNPADFEDYLSRYPDGVYSGLAKRRLAALTEVAALPPAIEAEAPEVGEKVLGLSREDRRLIQRALNDQGHKAGVEDGLFGRGTREAITSWQVASQAKATGYLAADQAKALIAAGHAVQVAVGDYPSTETLAPGQTFRDCPECPEMVVVPAGRFTMGSTWPAEPNRDSDEGPTHEVNIRSFALGKYEVTFAEYESCVQDGVCSYRPDDAGWGRDYRPVLNMAWNDAQSYVTWLSRKSRKSYRLPSESEWEYAARAGTTTPYSFGRTITPQQANFGRNVGKTSPVGSYPSNGWGLHDMHGNVWEWVEDCSHQSYEGAPRDGSAWTTGNTLCGQRVLRGGSWYDVPRLLRAANRSWVYSSVRVDEHGFRVARTL